MLVPFVAGADGNAGELENTFLWEHPTMLANTWERGAKPVFGAIAVPAGEAASLSPPQSLPKGLGAAPAMYWNQALGSHLDYTNQSG